MSQRGRSDISGRLLDGKLVLVPGSARPPAGGYAVDLARGVLYRNGEDVGDVQALEYDRDVLGWWVSYTTWTGSPIDPRWDQIPAHGAFLG